MEAERVVDALAEIRVNGRRAWVARRGGELTVETSDGRVYIAYGVWSAGTVLVIPATRAGDIHARIEFIVYDPLSRAGTTYTWSVHDDKPIRDALEADLRGCETLECVLRRLARSGKRGRRGGPTLTLRDERVARALAEVLESAGLRTRLVRAGGARVLVASVSGELDDILASTALHAAESRVDERSARRDPFAEPALLACGGGTKYRVRGVSVLSSGGFVVRGASWCGREYASVVRGGARVARELSSCRAARNDSSLDEAYECDTVVVRLRGGGVIRAVDARVYVSPAVMYIIAGASLDTALDTSAVIVASAPHTAYAERSGAVEGVAASEDALLLDAVQLVSRVTGETACDALTRVVSRLLGASERVARIVACLPDILYEETLGGASGSERPRRTGQYP